MAIASTSRQMFTAERRKMERAGMISPASSAGPSVEDVQGMVKHEVARLVDAAKTDIITQMKAAMQDLVAAANPEHADYMHVRQEVMSLKAERDDLLRKQEDLSLIKNEVHALTFSIESTKREIAALYRAQGNENRLEAMTGELDGIVHDTENATQNIMDIAEKIDDLSDRLRALAEGSGVIQDVAEEIASNTMQLFESCNFQDLTGQRITKVVNTLHLIDERLSKVVAIWGPEDIENMEVEDDPKGLDGLNMIIDQHAVHREKVSQDEADAIMSQDDLDALFG